MAGKFQDKNTLKERFIKKSINIHGLRYGYDRVKYDHIHSPVEIECFVHGYFWQTPSNHTNNRAGCRKCATEINASKRRFTKETIIEKSIEIHGTVYGYDKSIYINIDTPMLIICPIHGEFWQTPFHHTNTKCGCPKCSTGNISEEEISWIDSIGISSMIKQYRICLPDKTIKVDGYDPLTNTVYEYHGKFWHGHPDKFNADDIHPKIKIRCGDLYKQTLDREDEIRKLGYNLISVWA